MCCIIGSCINTAWLQQDCDIWLDHDMSFMRIYQVLHVSTNEEDGLQEGMPTLLKINQHIYVVKRKISFE